MQKPAISIKASSLSWTNSEGFVVTISLETMNVRAAGSVLPGQWFFRWLRWESMSAYPCSWLRLESLTTSVEARVSIGHCTEWLTKHMQCAQATARHRKRSPWTWHAFSCFPCICDKGLGWAMCNSLGHRMWPTTEFCLLSGHRSRWFFRWYPLGLQRERGFWSQAESPQLMSPPLVPWACLPYHALPVLSSNAILPFYLVMWLALLRSSVWKAHHSFQLMSSTVDILRCSLCASGDRKSKCELLNGVLWC